MKSLFNYYNNNYRLSALWFFFFSFRPFEHFTPRLFHAMWHVARRCPTSGIPPSPPPVHFPRTGEQYPLDDATAAGDARARITQVCSVIVAAALAAVDDLLVITRPYRTQLYLPTQSISQGTRRTRSPPPAPAILRSATPPTPCRARISNKPS